MKRIALILALVVTGVAAAATAVGPAPGDSAALIAGSARYTARADSGQTLVKTGSTERRIAGAWGFPRVAYDGSIGGLSTDRKTLVLVEQTHGRLASPSRFALLDAKTLAPRRTISIPGKFAFDALSPRADKLFLIQYVSVVGQVRYRVRSYDVAASRLDTRIIADKRSGWTAMEGQPLSRAMPEDGTWAYTLYASPTRTFVHALQTVAGYAICVDVPLDPADVNGLRLRLDGTRLSLVTRAGAERAVIDTVKLRVLTHA